MKNVDQIELYEVYQSLPLEKLQTHDKRPEELLQDDQSVYDATHAFYVIEVTATTYFLLHLKLCPTSRRVDNRNCV